MKNVIKLFVAIAVVGVMSVSAFAQGAGPGGGKGGAQGGQRGPGGPGGPGGGGGMRRGNRMKMDEEVLAKLNLTAPQKAKVKTLKEATQKKMQDLMKTMGPGPGAPGAGGKPGAGKAGGPGAGGGRPDPAKMKEMREKFKPIMEGYTKGLKGILTPPQFTAYEKGMKEAMDKMKAQFGGGKGPGGPGAGAGKGAGKGGNKPPTA